MKFLVEFSLLPYSCVLMEEELVMAPHTRAQKLNRAVLTNISFLFAYQQFVLSIISFDAM